MKVFIAVVSLAVAVSARMAYVLPDGADELLQRSLDTSFSCLDRPYGYYADVENDCAVFHVCHPIIDADGELVETAHFSFMCGNNTIFSQSSLTCTTVDDAYPCLEAASFYALSNSEFGLVDGSVAPPPPPPPSIPVPSARLATVDVVAPVIEAVDEAAALLLDVLDEELAPIEA